ncbi:MAG: DNA-3-methyladenine glycosylase 2 [Christensenellaceae bacterium]|nr:DNA-3-methyladenine glycosylase 2 [Christensenellaceae bacterium]
MYEKTFWKDNVLLVSGVERLDLNRTFACGQSFRWQRTERGWFGIAFGRGIYAETAEGVLRIFPCAKEEVPLWLNYFDLARDYAAIEAQLCADTRLCACVPFASGIRVLNQEPFETLITFILSANNNAGRIAGIVMRLCACAGEPAVMQDGREYRRFPTPEAVAALEPEALRSIGAGYRAPYVKESAHMVADGFDLEALRAMPLAEARKALSAFPGVGPKVADCILLFSLGHTDAFPVDVWIGRALKTLFFDGQMPGRQETERLLHELGPMSGIIQQYVFHYARERKLATKHEKREGKQ